MTHILVGVDGSAGSRAALRWALDIAESLTQASVEVLFVNEPGPRVRAERSNGGATAGETLHEVLAHLGRRPEVAIRARAAVGVAPAVLVRESDAVDLVVVGSRGHGGVGRSRIGPVADFVVNHACCPVTVVTQC